MTAVTEAKSLPPLRQKVYSIELYNLQVQSKPLNRVGQDLVATA